MSFEERWDRMTVVERIAYIRADWQSCQETHDPLVLRIASAVAHDVCRQAADEIEMIRGELAACRIAYEHAIKDRDAARLAYCRDAFYLVGDEDEQRQLTPREIAGRQGWPWPISTAETGR